MDAVVKSEVPRLEFITEDDLEVAFTHVEEEPLLQMNWRRNWSFGFSVSPILPQNMILLSEWMDHPDSNRFGRSGYIWFVGMIVLLVKLTRKESRWRVTLQDASGNDGVVVFPSTAEVYLQFNKHDGSEEASWKGQKGQWQLQIKPHVSDEFCR